MKPSWIPRILSPILMVPFLTSAPAMAASVVKVAGYLDYKKPNALIVDGQRLQFGPKTRFSGSGVKTIDAIPLGYEVKGEGNRDSYGAIVATKIEAKPNGTAMYESDVMAGTNHAESTWVSAGAIVEQGSDGQMHSMGALKTKGPEVDRARRIVDRLLPAYVNPKAVRVYVVENKEWNAMAMANFSIYVFTGIMADLNDDELAIVLGHELTHAAYEHSRRQAQKSMYTGIGGSIAALGASKLSPGIARADRHGGWRRRVQQLLQPRVRRPGGPRRPSLRLRGGIRLPEGAAPLAPVRRKVR
jgi:peptidase M48-like protein